MFPLHTQSHKNQTLAQVCHELNIKEKDLISAEQIHGDGISVVNKRYLGQKISLVDALITSEKGVPLVIRTADCAPILIYDPQKNILALVHAGRKGTELEITTKTIEKMKSLGSNPKDLTAKIGPCIGKCCYPMDIGGENLKQLEKAGVQKEKIDIHPDCTCCNTDKYYSYRGDGPGTGRMFLVAML
ncbi:MAG: polyphenol oxidase family protein [Candidatus Margulisbacteria bacterium]|nr:polyphenol oxidase family protein [Candidatus Margulisiibacteriota bacterium]MBU1022620.1 polyphenol oxidase family protein [Candidatus Margulisiibacteriota bacterium]MBU1729443.1 polyphenol oxidase family protein [Candidatus Margulisiibacteriota bacterium]MBU1955456.1 polyphenol oxidase family protein [Candidatus Margulisiibacteriota bacterium]